MGSCYYFIKARFDNAEQSLPKLRSFFEEGIKAEGWWQQHRGMEREGKRAEFWQGFKTEFPQIYDYLTRTKLADGDCNNQLAGQLDFGREDELDNLRMEEGVISHTTECWHFADWDPLADYLKQKFGATHVAWINEESVPSPMESLTV